MLRSNMLNYQQLVIDRFIAELKHGYREIYADLEPRYPSVLEWTARLALGNLSNCDALYHNTEHTILVTTVGQVILQGKHLLEGGVAPSDWVHYLMGLLCHDIGYVRGVCEQDGDDRLATGIGDETFEVSPHATDVALAPYHVDRGKQFVLNRFGGSSLIDVDAQRVADYIEMTRFPVPDDDFHGNTSGYHGLIRAADFIGQLGDPNYMRKMPALYYEFAETGSLKQMGYNSPGDMRRSYSQFYWKVVEPLIVDAVPYLRITHEGKQWLVNLHSHVFDVEHGKV